MASIAPTQDEEWSEGPRLEAPGLADAILTLWCQAATLVGEADQSLPAPIDVIGAESMLAEIAAWLVAALEAGPESDRVAAGRLLVRQGRLVADLREETLARRIRGFAEVHAALGRLRSMGTIDQMMERAPAEAARCGFDRVMIARVDNGHAVPAHIHMDGDPKRAEEILRVGRARPTRIDHMLLESEMLRRRGPVLVVDAANDPRVHEELMRAADVRSYVAAPIMPQGRVIGFIHADCHTQRRTVDEFDRDLLWMFAEGFGHAYERAVLLERLRALRQEVRRANSSILAVMDDFCDAEVEMTRAGAEDQGVARTAAAMFVTSDSRVESLLTPRELDVIRLMATGETNAGIARRLVVAEGTVKSHVKHILRKLRASNRAEAVSRFVRLSQSDGNPG